MKFIAPLLYPLLFAAGAALAQDAPAQRPAPQPQGQPQQGQQQPGQNDQQQSAQQDEAARPLDAEDAKTLSTLIAANLAEIEAGRLAEKKARRDDVKRFAAHMVEEHTKMLEEARKLAQSRGVQVPAAPDKEHQDAFKKLEKADGAKFDRKYIAQMVKDHEKALNVARDATYNADDAALKAYAQKGTPHIDEHLKMAREIADRIQPRSQGLGNR